MAAFGWLVLALISCAAFNRSSGTKELIFDIALVINTRPYVEGTTDANGKWTADPELATTARSKSGLEEFISAFVDRVKISETQLRVAVVNARVDRGIGGTGNFRPVLSLKLSLKYGSHKTVVIDSMKNLDEIDLKLETEPQNAYWYDPQMLGDDVAKMVFEDDIDRLYVPNMIVLLAIVRGEKLKQDFADAFPGIHIRLIADSFESAAKVNFASHAGESVADIDWTTAAGHLVDDLQNLAASCQVATKPRGCYFATAKRSQCRTEHIYKVVKDSTPSGFCLNGTGPPKDCVSENDCKSECEMSLHWAACNCNSGTKSRFRNTTDLPEKYYRFCPYFDQAVPCSEECPKPFPPWAVAVICVVIGLLMLTGIAIGAYCLMQKSRRGRSPSPHHHHHGGRRR